MGHAMPFKDMLSHIDEPIGSPLTYMSSNTKASVSPPAQYLTSTYNEAHSKTI